MAPATINAKAGWVLRPASMGMRLLLQTGSHCTALVVAGWLTMGILSCDFV
jgi:hypothetical protein